ncbi:Hypothetical protein R9X50_00474400 [Acrodontium crateriforme]|uniref:Shugoshin n=1 Tax=Acrodontium crateriforme TaxID=150365 RepID=A0AAQ3RB10_9PEZI|nr:Hypothetical protein R9X50_00474400 [Acrodontium crateriforme]
MRTKSRPNITGPPADFDEVKRRFIRQNRELAKNNSNQSLRIRSLEIEVSRLLADNLDLREQVLQLQGEVYNAQANGSAHVVERVKEDLHAKIAELSDLVQGMDALKCDVKPRERQTRERPQNLEHWRERQTLVDVMRENQMPTITEDKQYPRRTLNGDEIKAIRLSGHSSNESPDLGPPPVAHFDYEDPVKQLSPSANRGQTTVALDEGAPVDLSANLETRRKRKDGQPRLEIRRDLTLSQSPSKPTNEPPVSLRTGAKRKLADREIEATIKPPSKDDFTFSRRVTSIDATNEANAAAEIQSQNKADEEIILVAKPTRRILGDKTTNTSPRKTSIHSEKTGKEKAVDEPVKKPAMSKADKPTARNQARAKRLSSIPLPTPSNELVVNSIELAPPDEPLFHELDPKTPACLDILSPLPSEPSTRTVGGRDGTPPPSDLNTSASDVGRPSRRARAAVNYAEPSLVAKMRRPGKQMADAVTGLQDPRRAMSTSTEKKSARTMAIKTEGGDDRDAWKSLPSATRIEATSPLNKKSTSDESSTRAENLPGSDQIIIAKPSASSTVISSLIAASTRPRRDSLPAKTQPLGIDMDIDATAKKMHELDLYDFKDSSSPKTDSQSKLTTTTLKAQRRHSSVPKTLRSTTNLDPLTTEEPIPNASLPSGLAPGRSERAASRRKSMML